MEFKSQSYYDVLEISPDASFHEIKNAYFRIKNTYSKDSPALYTLFDEHDTKDLLNKVEIAYLVLSNPEKRKEYDKTHGFIGRHEPSAETSYDNNSITGSIEPEVQQTQNKAQQWSSSSAATSQEMQPSLATSMPPLSQPQKHGTSYNSDISPHISIKENVLSVIRRHHIVKGISSNPETDKEINEATECNGGFLKKVREYRNVSIDELSDFTKISKTYLQAIEDQNFQKLPAKVFVRGFVGQIAKALKLDIEKVVRSYMSLFTENRK